MRMKVSVVLDAAIILCHQGNHLSLGYRKLCATNLNTFKFTQTFGNVKVKKSGEANAKENVFLLKMAS